MHTGVAVMPHVPLMYWPAAHWLVHGAHAVWLATAWYVPAAHAAQLGSADPPHTWYPPAGHVLAGHGWHAVWVPFAVWYVPNGQGRHEGDVVAVHVPVMYVPGAHVVMQGLHVVPFADE